MWDRHSNVYSSWGIHVRMEKSHNNELEYKQIAIIAVVYLVVIFANLIECIIIV